MKQALTEVIRLTDDSTWSHAARMVKIKALVAGALLELETAEKAAAEALAVPAKKPIGRPVGAVNKAPAHAAPQAFAVKPMADGSHVATILAHATSAPIVPET